MGKRSSEWLNQVTYLLWVYAFVFAIVFAIFSFYTPTAYAPKHTYQTSVPPGTLQSDRWGFQFIVIGMYTLVWFVPLTLGFLADRPLSSFRFGVHLTVLVVLFIWLAVVMGFGIFDWVHANGTSSANYDNPANDDRWCCVHFALPGAPCVNTAPCVPAVGVNDLTTNGTFLFRFWYTVVFLVAIILDFTLLMATFRPAVLTYLRENKEAGTAIKSRIPLNNKMNR